MLLHSFITPKDDFFKFLSIFIAALTGFDTPPLGINLTWAFSLTGDDFPGAPIVDRYQILERQFPFCKNLFRFVEMAANHSVCSFFLFFFCVFFFSSKLNVVC